VLPGVAPNPKPKPPNAALEEVPNNLVPAVVVAAAEAPTVG